MQSTINLDNLMECGFRDGTGRDSDQIPDTNPI